MPTEIRCDIHPGLYGSRAQAVDGISSGSVRVPAEHIRGEFLLLPVARGVLAPQPYTLPIPLPAMRDVAARILTAYEFGFGGYEAPSRLFLNRHLQSGDVFLDIGAHWGLYTLDVASRRDSSITVIAYEPVPPNCRVLNNALSHNVLNNFAEVAAVAVTDRVGTASMVAGNSMTSRVQHRASTPSLSVPTTSIDSELKCRPELAGRRIFMKVDVEGAEASVLRGARNAIEGGDVAAIVLEYLPRQARPQLLGELHWLQSLGYRLYRFAHHHMSGALMNFASDDTVCNIVCVAPSLKVEHAYVGQWCGYAPLPPEYFWELAPGAQQQRTQRLREAGATDGTRWSDLRNCDVDVDQRMRILAELIDPACTTLDVGAGSMRLREHLDDNTPYTPADIVARAADTVLVDLNEPLPVPITSEQAVLSGVLEHVHDPAAVLRWCAAGAPVVHCTIAMNDEDTQASSKQHFGKLAAAAGLEVFATRAADRVMAYSCKRRA